MPSTQADMADTAGTPAAGMGDILDVVTVAIQVEAMAGAAATMVAVAMATMEDGVGAVLPQLRPPRRL